LLNLKLTTLKCSQRGFTLLLFQVARSALSFENFTTLCLAISLLLLSLRPIVKNPQNAAEISIQIRSGRLAAMRPIARAKPMTGKKNQNSSVTGRGENANLR
jgi:hypothetical protein